jgi:hypothetical protein
MDQARRRTSATASACLTSLILAAQLKTCKDLYLDTSVPRYLDYVGLCRRLLVADSFDAKGAVTGSSIPADVLTDDGDSDSDLNFLIPELVEEVWCETAQPRRATSRPPASPFVDRLERGLVQATPGTDGFGRLLIADSLDAATGGTLLGGLEETL